MSVEQAIQIIWTYMKVGQSLRHCDAIFVLCSIDEQVAIYGAQLFLDGYGDRLLLSGGIAHTDDILATGWKTSEAEHFAHIAHTLGVPKDKMILETRATNTGENIRFMYDILIKQQLSLQSIMLVQKPTMERRTYATFKKQWPDPKTLFLVTSPQQVYSDYFQSDEAREIGIHVMVGDLQRIKEYPALGYQIPQEVPQDVMLAYNRLIDAGYTKHLIR